MVRINQGGAALLQALGDRTFTAADASGQADAEYVTVQMYASVASGQATPEAAAREAERRARRIFRR